jgi:hypothetical protein
MNLGLIRTVKKHHLLLSFIKNPEKTAKNLAFLRFPRHLLAPLKRKPQ